MFYYISLALSLALGFTLSSFCSSLGFSFWVGATLSMLGGCVLGWFGMYLDYLVEKNVKK